MTTLHLGIEELIARRQNETVEQTTRHTWHLTEFWRARGSAVKPDVQLRRNTWRGELVEWGVTAARLAML